MARLMYEFFRPRLSLPVIFPIGVITQDDTGVVYRSIPDVQLPEDVDRGFYGLDEREAFMNSDFLVRLAAAVPENGSTLAVQPSDERLLTALERRGTHHFLYGSAEEMPGAAKDVAEAEAQRLTDKAARRELTLRFGDAATRAVLEAYA